LWLPSDAERLFPIRGLFDEGYHEKWITQPTHFVRFAVLLICVCGFVATFVLAQEKSDFPDRFDAFQAAPNSHKVLFENAFVRVLEVWTPVGTREPMHQNRWPSTFLTFDAGGRTTDGLCHRPDGTFREVPSTTSPVLDPPIWRVR
jgi:hypothetical protein